MNIRTFIREYYEELMEILNCVKVGIYIADGDSKTILVNDESEKTGGLKRDELIGKSMEELIHIGYVEDSSILRAIESGKEESIMQELGDGGRVYITGVPLLKNGKTELVVCTERDITETINLKELLRDTEQRYKAKLALLQKQNFRKQGKIIASSKKMIKVMDEAVRIAKLDTTVIILGESGTGKELLANLIYENSIRDSKPFIKVNCAAVPESLMESEFFGYEKGAFTGADEHGKLGFFELANEGILFLDEIGELPIQMQSKLLRVLQEREIMRVGGDKPIAIDVRIITATNVDLEQAVARGTFREDLYYRLNIIPIVIPPLRERKDDISIIAAYFVSVFNKQYNMNKELTEDGIRALEEYHWPGNVRQLRNIVERIMVSFDGRHISSFQVLRQLVRSPDLVEKQASQKDENQSLEELMQDYEKRVLIETLEKAGNATEAAKLLKVNKSTISRKLKKYGIGGK